MFKVWFINFGYYSQDRFASEHEALSYIKDKCFEASIINQNGDTIGSWSPIGGYRGKR